MLGRLLDDSYPSDVRTTVTLMTFAKFTTNAAYRFAVPFLATIASGLGISLGRLGVGLAITELLSLSAPLVGRIVERMARRSAMSYGLVGVAAGSAIAGSAHELPVFVIGLSVMATAKIFYDLAVGAYVADRVPFGRRSRVLSLLETSWATGLLVGVSLLALVVAVASWHVAYFVVAAVVLVAAGAIHRSLPHEPAGTQHTAGRTISVAGTKPSWSMIVLTALSIGLLAGASQFVFVTFGSWLEERFDFSATELAAVAFGLGAIELVSSMVSVRHTDRWGKERCVVLGSVAMLAGALVLAAGATHLSLVLGGIGVFVMGFELAIISGMPLGAELTPDAPARGLGMMIFALATTRALVAIPATQWLETHGIAWPAIGAAALTVAAAALISIRRRRITGPAAPVAMPATF